MLHEPDAPCMCFTFLFKLCFSVLCFHLSKTESKLCAKKMRSFWQTIKKICGLARKIFLLSNKISFSVKKYLVVHSSNSRVHWRLCLLVHCLLHYNNSQDFLAFTAFSTAAKTAAVVSHNISVKNSLDRECVPDCYVIHSVCTLLKMSHLSNSHFIFGYEACKDLKDSRFAPLT